MVKNVAVCSPIMQQDMVDGLNALAGVKAFGCAADALPALADEVDGIVILTFHYTPPLAARMAEAANKIKWIQLLTAGYDQLEAIGVNPSVTVANAGDTWSPSVSEHTMALMLALSRQARDCETAQRTSRWDSAIRHRVKPLLGLTLLVVGFGSIGREVAVRARAFGMRVAGVTRSGRPQPEADIIHPAERLHDALGEADIVVVAAPSSAANHHLIGARELAACKAGALIVNIARGSLIDTEALIDALSSGHLGGAGLDVTDPEPLPEDSPLWGMPNVIVTPHIGGAASAQYNRRLVDHVVGNGRAFAAGHALRSVVPVPPYRAPAEG